MRNLTGERFGRLTAVYDVGSNNNRRMWLCVCECGNKVVVKSDSLVCGNTKSCGCLLTEKRVSANTTHGDCGTRLYRIWKGMLSRCRNKGSTDYKWYGEKGVSVCDEWQKYEAFKKWALHSGYKEHLTIDRINPYGNYSPENCRWATVAEQNMNRRKEKDGILE